MADATDRVALLKIRLENAMFRHKSWNNGVKKWRKEAKRWTPGTKQWTRAMDQLDECEERAAEEWRKVMETIEALKTVAA